MSKIYRLFLPHFPETFLVKDDEGNNYVASRAIKNLRITYDEVINHQSIVYGFGTMLCLDYIFGDSDLTGNYGFQKHGDSYIAFKFDNECFFDQDMLSQELPSSLFEIESRLPPMTICFGYKNICKNEIAETIKLILEKKEEIKKIILDTVKSESAEEGYWMMNKVIKAADSNPDDKTLQSLKKSFQKQLESKSNHASYNSKDIINKLNARFEALDKILNKKSTIMPLFKS